MEWNGFYTVTGSRRVAVRKWLCWATRAASLFLKHKHGQQLDPPPVNSPLLGFLSRAEHALGRTHKKWVRSVVLFLEEALNLSSQFVYKGWAERSSAPVTLSSALLDFTLCFHPRSSMQHSKHKRWAHFLYFLLLVCGRLHIKEWLARLLLVAIDLITGNF